MSTWVKSHDSKDKNIIYIVFQPAYDAFNKESFQFKHFSKILVTNFNHDFTKYKNVTSHQTNSVIQFLTSSKFYQIKINYKLQYL